MKTEQITYEVFLQAVNKMQEQGEKLTVRNVIAQIGGSFGKIAEYLKRFSQERANSLFSKQTDISDVLRQAVLSELGKAVGEAKLVLESQVNQLMVQLDEYNEQIKVQEQTIILLREENRILQELKIMAQQDIKNIGIEKDNLTHQLASVQNEKMLAVTEAEKSKLQLARADQDNLEMKEIIKALQAKIELLTQEKFEAEKMAAVSEAQCEQFRKQKKP